MDVRPPSPTPGGESIREHVHDFVELLAGERSIRVGPPNQIEELVFLPLLGGRRGHDLLGQDVERLLRDDQPVQLPPPNGPEKRHALHQLVTAQRKQPTLGHGTERVTRSADALQERGEPAWRADLTDQIHRADVDPELQRRCGHQRPKLALLEALLTVQS